MKKKQNFHLENSEHKSILNLKHLKTGRSGHLLHYSIIIGDILNKREIFRVCILTFYFNILQYCYVVDKYS